MVAVVEKAHGLGEFVVLLPLPVLHLFAGLYHIGCVKGSRSKMIIFLQGTPNMMRDEMVLIIFC